MNNLNGNNSLNINPESLEGQIDTKNQINSRSEAQDNLAQDNQFVSGMLASVSKFDINSIKPQEWIAKTRENLKPWSEFASFSKFKKPVAFSPTVSRVVKNVNYFQTNYLFVFAVLALYCILTSPLLLFAFFAIAGAFYIAYLKAQNGKIKIHQYELNLTQLYALIGVFSIPVFLLAGGGSAVFWIIGASIVIILLHASFYARDEQLDPFNLQVV